MGSCMSVNHYYKHWRFRSVVKAVSVLQLARYQWLVIAGAGRVIVKGTAACVGVSCRVCRVVVVVVVCKFLNVL